VLAPTNVIDFTASFDADGKSVSLFGHAKGPSKYAFFLRDDTGRADEVAQAAAASIIQQEQRRGEIAVQPLPPSDYLPVVDALSTYATFETVDRSWKQQKGRPDFTQKYKEQLGSIGKIAEKYTQWAELQWLAAEIAERAGDREKALAFTVNEQLLTPRDDPRYEKLNTRMARLTEKTFASMASGEARTAARAAAGQIPPNELVAPFRTLMGVPAERPPHDKVRVAFVGMPWPEAGKFTILRSVAEQDETLSDYTTSVLQTMRMIAPDATYEFVGVSSDRGAMTESEIALALAAVKDSDAEILVFSYGGKYPPSVKLLRALASQMVVVVPAGMIVGHLLSRLLRMWRLSLARRTSKACEQTSPTPVKNQCGRQLRTFQSLPHLRVTCRLRREQAMPPPLLAGQPRC
jgi:hypothetical protein